MVSPVTLTMNPERATVERLVREALRERLGSGTGSSGRRQPPTRDRDGQPNPLVVNISARHAHVTRAHLEQLFGPGAKLTKQKDLYQQGEFASEQQVNLIAPGAPGSPRNRMIPNIRILGPTRDYTQVELSYTDGVYLGLDLPLRISGNHEGTPGGILVGPSRRGEPRPRRDPGRAARPHEPR